MESHAVTGPVSLVNSLHSLAITEDTKNSEISTTNDSLLSNEISIFEAIAETVIGLFKGIVSNITPQNSYESPTKKGKVGKNTPIKNEFNELQYKVSGLNQLILEYNKIVPDTVSVFNVMNKELLELSKQRIQRLIDGIDEMTKNRPKLIDSFHKFINIASNSKILQNSFLPKTQDEINTIVKNLTQEYSGIDEVQLRRELVGEALQKTLAKFVRAMTLLDNMKHRLNLKLMILNRNEPDKPNRVTQILSAAIAIDDALKRFVDEPAVSLHPDEVLTSDNAIEALRNIRKRAEETVATLAPSDNNSNNVSSAVKHQPPINENVDINDDMSQPEMSQSDVNPFDNADMDQTLKGLITLLTTLKDGIKTLPSPETEKQLTEEENGPTEEEIALAEEEKALAEEEKALAEKEIALAEKEIQEIIKENTSHQVAAPAGGKLHKQKRRVKWSTPRRRRNSRVKSMKPKKIQNRRKTKSAHKKRGTKKH